jgi:hypothetical protein
MTEEAKKEPQPFTIDLAKLMPQIAQYYVQFGWVASLMGLKVPPEVDRALRSIASGKPPSAEEMQMIKNQVETMQGVVGEPVMTRQLAETAWYLHTKEGMGTREIAEQFAKDGSPCSHTTVARWINMVDAEKRFGKIARLIQIGKILGFAGIVALAIIIGKFLL